MLGSFGPVIVAGNFLAFTLSIILGVLAFKALKGGVLMWTSALYIGTAILYLCHAAVENFGLGDELKAITALCATLFVLFSVVIINITAKMMGVK